MCNYRDKFRENRATIVVVLTLVGPPLSGDQNLFETVLWKWWRVNRWNIVIIIHQKLHTVHLFQFRIVCYTYITNKSLLPSCLRDFSARMWKGYFCLKIIWKLILSSQMERNLTIVSYISYLQCGPCSEHYTVLSALYNVYVYSLFVLQVSRE